jgi:hypothetical protein
MAACSARTQLRGIQISPLCTVHCATARCCKKAPPIARIEWRNGLRECACTTMSFRHGHQHRRQPLLIDFALRRNGLRMKRRG